MIKFGLVCSLKKWLITLFFLACLGIGQANAQFNYFFPLTGGDAASADGDYCRKLIFYLIPVEGEPNPVKVSAIYVSNSGNQPVLSNYIATQPKSMPSTLQLGFVGSSKGCTPSSDGAARIEIRNLRIATPIGLSSTTLVNAATATNGSIVSYSATLSNNIYNSLIAPYSATLTIAPSQVDINPVDVLSADNIAKLEAVGISMTLTGKDASGNFLYIINSFPNSTSVTLNFPGTLNGRSGIYASVVVTITPPTINMNTDLNGEMSKAPTFITDTPISITFSKPTICGGGTASLIASLPPGLVASETVTIQLVRNQTSSAVETIDYINLAPRIIIPVGVNSVTLSDAFDAVNQNVINKATTLTLDPLPLTPGYILVGLSPTITIINNHPSNRIVVISSAITKEGLSTTLTASLVGSVITESPLVITINSSNIDYGGNFLSAPFSYVITDNQNNKVTLLNGNTEFNVVIPAHSNAVNFTIQTASDKSYYDNIFSINGAITPVSGIFASCDVEKNYVINSGVLSVTNIDLIPITLAFSPTIVTVGTAADVYLLASIEASAPSAVTDVFISTMPYAVSTTAINNLNYTDLVSDITIKKGDWTRLQIPFLKPLDSHCIGGSSLLTLSGLLPAALSTTYFIANKPSIKIVNPVNPDDMVINIGSAIVAAGSSISLSVNLPNSGLGHKLTTCDELTLIITPNQNYPNRAGNFLVNPFSYTLYDKANAPINSVINGNNSSFSVTIPAGENGTFFTVSTTVDLMSYYNNVFLLKGKTAALGYTINDGQLTVNNTRTVPISITFVDQTGVFSNIVYGNDEGTSPAYLLASLPEGIVAINDINIAFVAAPASSAMKEIDYLNFISSIKIPVGANSASITVIDAKNRGWLGLSTTLYLNCRITDNSFFNIYKVSSISPMTYIVDTTDKNPDNRVAIISSGTVQAGLSITLNVSLTGSIRTLNPIIFTITPSSLAPIGSIIANSTITNGNQAFQAVIPAGGNISSFIINTTNNGGIVDMTYPIDGAAPKITVIEGELAVLAIEQATPTVNGNIEVCEGSELVLSATKLLPNKGLVTYHWVGPNSFSDITQKNETVVNKKVDTSMSGVYKVTTTAIGYNPSPPASIFVTINPAPKIEAGNDITMVSGDKSVKIEAEASGVGLSYEWTPADYLDNNRILQPTVTIPEAGLKPLAGMEVKYELEVRDAYGCVSEDSLTIHIPLFIPNVFTPDGDGQNDSWIIEQIGQHPHCIVSVYTRWGEPSFKSVGYPIPWDGVCQGVPCVAGAYYYVIDLKNGEDKLGGVVSIVR